MAKFTFNQEDLDLMSKDIELNSNEIHMWNDFYGDAFILKKSLLFPSKFFYSIIEHGIGFDQNIWHVDQFSKLRSAIVFSNFRQIAYQQKTNKYVFNIGSILNYVKLKDIYKKNGSIYFLTHSTHELDVNINLQRIIDELQNLSSDIKPKYICIYWKDILRGKHQIFLDNGYKVISAGHIYDKYFLYRLKEILNNFEVLLTSELGSHVFHGHACGLKILVPKNLTSCYLEEKYSLSNFFEQNNEKDDFETNLLTFNMLNDFFINIFNKEDFFHNQIQINFLDFFCTNKKVTRIDLTLIHIFSLFVYKFKPKGFFLHFVDYIYVRIIKKIK